MDIYNRFQINNTFKKPLFSTWLKPLQIINMTIILTKFL